MTLEGEEVTLPFPPAPPPAAIVLPTPAITATWSAEHAKRLAYVYSRSELHAAWAQVPTAARRATFPRRAAAMAADVARRDARLLAHQHPSARSVLAAAQRVSDAGTPTWWTGAHVDAHTPCPLRPPAWPGHQVQSATDPTCRYCAVLAGRYAPVERAELARQVWKETVEHYGLSLAQVAGAIDALADAVDAHRGLALTPRRARAAAPPAQATRAAKGCRHLWSGVDPICRYCATVMEEPQEIEVMDRRDLGSEVWKSVGRHYGLSEDQVQRAVFELRNLINARRGISLPRRHAGAPTAGARATTGGHGAPEPCGRQV